MNVEEKRINLEMLKEVPELTDRIQLILEPLVPLSMVSEFPGSYYKTLDIPSKKMLCGLFENIFGWHFSPKYREEIIKDISKIRKKKDKAYKHEKYDYSSSYKPLLMEHFDVLKCEIKSERESIKFNDFWKRQYRRGDAGKTHVGGCANMDYRVIQDLENIVKDPMLFEAQKGYFPTYYTTPTNREYVDIGGYYVIDLKVSSFLGKCLHESLDNNIGYLGTSEGWINIEIGCYENK
ncbi:MAG: type I-PGING CRISPR-associated protein Cas5p [Porphyromonas sp.]|nr:type I-PGING CRISPR-associated protein Cas5p [Porphyromonas sp.]